MGGCSATVNGTAQHADLGAFSSSRNFDDSTYI